MKWVDKMDAVVKDILGIEYTCVVDSETTFKIFENDHEIVKHLDIRPLESHWRSIISDTLKTIFSQRIQQTLLKY
jgi:hypothetical protein